MRLPMLKVKATAGLWCRSRDYRPPPKKKYIGVLTSQKSIGGTEEFAPLTGNSERVRVIFQ